MLIFWDIDGVILHCGAAGTHALIDTFDKLYGIENAFEGLAIGRSMDRVLLNKVFEKYGIPEADLPKIEEEYVEQLKVILQALSSCAECNEVTGSIDADGFRDCARNDRPLAALPGVRALLDISSFSHSILTSNLFVGAKVKLESVGLWAREDGTHYFTGGGFGDYPDEKWDAAERARKELEDLIGRNIPQKEVVLIGDSVYDIKTARACGYHVISVATGFAPMDVLKAESPDALFADLSDTAAVVKAIEDFAKLR